MMSNTKARAGQHESFRKTMLFVWIDEAWRECYGAAIKEGSEYDAVEYDRLWRVADALVMAWCDGDESYAKALKECWLDSQSSMSWYTTQWTRDQLVYNQCTWSTEEERDELMRRLDLLEDEDEPTSTSR
jgi:hypothetical protein